MITLLNKIKPKRLSESLKGYVFKDKIVLDFGATKVLCLGDTGISSSSPLCLTHKDLFNQELDNGMSCQYNIGSIPTKWFDLNVNLSDNSFFSAISGTGEDLFWSSVCDFTGGTFSARVAGLNYMCEYLCDAIKPAKEKLDYHMFYYLFQMTKHLTGKKTDTLLWAKDPSDTMFYLTNREHDYYVICNGSDSIMSWKAARLNEIMKIYVNKNPNMQQVFKKVLNEKSSPLFKALSRPFGDLLKIEECKQFWSFQDERYKLWMLKKKD